ncbi:MAG: outer membrane protein assembly factor BamA [Candidatus Omnitrophica bacterium]|nr:outer membrane protein assembly factor BamA [Candidatus Omnitrophota bacterium]
MQRRTFVFLLIISLFSGLRFVSYAADEASIPAVTSTAKQEPQKLVTAVEVTGNKAISTNVIISKMKTRVGSPYQETVISDDLKRLYLLGYFSDIKIDTENYKDGLKVVIKVVERPIISKITFSGLYRLTMKDDKLKEKLKSKESQYLDYPSLSEDVNTIKQLYEKIGFNQANIEYKVDLDKVTNKAAVEFSVIEGKKVRIKDINVTGNKAFTSAHILKLLKTKSAWFFNPGVVKDEVLKEDMERIKAFYQRNGFVDIAVNYEIVPDAQKAFFLHVNIIINEGKKYLVGNVTILGNKDIIEKTLLSSLKECLPGQVFSQEALKVDVSNIQGVYFDRGYISVQIDDATSVNTQSGRVDVTYNIVENKVAYVNKIKVRGNIKTKDIVVRREMRVKPGEKFDGDKLRRSKERLTNLGFFEDVSYDTEDAGAEDKKNLVVEVKESKTGAFSFGGGYSTVDSFVGFAEIEQKNFDWRNWPYFTGAGQDLKLRASIGSTSNAFELSFTEPWLFDYPIASGFDIYKREHERDTDVGYGYDENVLGGDLRLGKELKEYLRTDLMYRIDQIRISNISTDASASLQDEEGKKVISSLTPSLTFDNRDNVFDPHRGNYVSGSVEWAGGPLQGDKNFWKFFGQASHFTPMPRNAAIEFKGRIGLGEPYGDSNSIPIYERFFTGGAYTVRGYEERKLGPIDPNSKDPLGGNATLIGNIEYTYPLFTFLKVAAFYDVGNTWDKIAHIGSKKDANGVSGTGGFKSGVGLGVRLKTPLGPISLDYGIPMDKEPGETSRKSGRFHFSASHGF